MRIALTLAALLALSVPASAATPAEALDQAATCMAFVAVEAGLDGKKDPPPAARNALRALSSEMSFRASAAGRSDEQAQYLVVSRLVEMNTYVRDPASGGSVAKLRERLGGGCDALVAAVSRPR